MEAENAMDFPCQTGSRGLCIREDQVFFVMDREDQVFFVMNRLMAKVQYYGIWWEGKSVILWLDEKFVRRNYSFIIR